MSNVESENLVFLSGWPTGDFSRNVSKTCCTSEKKNTVFIFYIEFIVNSVLCKIDCNSMLMNNMLFFLNNDNSEWF